MWKIRVKKVTVLVDPYPDWRHYTDKILWSKLRNGTNRENVYNFLKLRPGEMSWVEALYFTIAE